MLICVFVVEKTDFYRSIWNCLNTASRYLGDVIFLEDKVLIGDGVDHGFAWWTTMISSVGVVDDDWGGLVVDGEGGHHLNYESMQVWKCSSMQVCK